MTTKTILSMKISFDDKLSSDIIEEIVCFIKEGYGLKEIDSMCQVKSKVIDCFEVEYYPLEGKNE